MMSDLHVVAGKTVFCLFGEKRIHIVFDIRTEEHAVFCTADLKKQRGIVLIVFFIADGGEHLIIVGIVDVKTKSAYGKGVAAVQVGQIWCILGQLWNVSITVISS